MWRWANGAQVSDEEKARLCTALLATLPLPAEQFAEEAFYKVDGLGRTRVCGAQATCNAGVPAQPYRQPPRSLPRHHHWPLSDSASYVIFLHH